MDFFSLERLINTKTLITSLEYLSFFPNDSKPIYLPILITVLYVYNYVCVNLSMSKLYISRVAIGISTNQLLIYVKTDYAVSTVSLSFFFYHIKYINFILLLLTYNVPQSLKGIPLQHKIYIYNTTVAYPKTEIAYILISSFFFSYIL